MASTYSNRLHRIAVSSFFFLMGFCFASWASRIPVIQQKLSLTEAQLGIILFSLPAGLFISLPISGWLVAKIGSKKTVSFAVVAYAFILVFLGLANSKFQLSAALFAFGLIGNMANISVNTQAVGVEQLYRKNIMASFHGIWSVAGFTGAALGTFINSLHIIPTYHFIIVLVIALVIFLFTNRFLLTTDKGTGENQPLFVLPDKSLLTLGLIAFFSMICEGAMFDWSGIYFKKVVEAPPSLVGAGYTAFMCTMALSRFVADYFTVRFGFIRVVQASGIIILAGLLIAVIFPYLYSAIAGFLLVGVGVSSIVPLVYSAAGKSKLMSPGIAIASVSTISFLGFLLGPPVIGLLADAASLRLSFSVIAAMGLCVTILATLTRQEY